MIELVGVLVKATHGTWEYLMELVSGEIQLDARTRGGGQPLSDSVAGSVGSAYIQGLH